MATNFFEGNDKAEGNKTLTRTGIMNALRPVVVATLAGIEGLSLANVAHLRRTVRALATLAARMMLDAGADPQTVAATLIEALAHEIDERAAKAQAEGAAQVAEAQAEGGAAILAFPKNGDLKN